MRSYIGINSEYEEQVKFFFKLRDKNEKKNPGERLVQNDDRAAEVMVRFFGGGGEGADLKRAQLNNRSARVQFWVEFCGPF